MRIILYTGKGGVGKTSVSSATGVLCADRGYRTLVMSTDPAHSLSDSMDRPLGPDPVPVAPNLWGQEIDVLKEVQRYWRTVRDWLVALMRWQGMEEVVAEEMAVLPGMEELVGLLYIVRYAETRAYDVLIVDCAPTGETMRLLSFPDAARWYMQRLFPIGRRAATTVGPLAHVLTGMPTPSGKVFDTIQDLFHQLERMRAILSDGERSSVRLVVNPEKMVIREAERTFTYLNLYGYHTDLVVCNRLLPDRVTDPFFGAWRESQARHLEAIRDAFDPIPILTAPLLDREVVGLEALRELGRALFGDRDPAQVFYRGQPQEVTREGRYHILKLSVPFASREDLDLIQHGEELVIQAGRYRRHLILPRVLATLQVDGAVLEDGVLKVRFVEEGPTR